MNEHVLMTHKENGLGLSGLMSLCPPVSVIVVRSNEDISDGLSWLGSQHNPHKKH